MTPLQNLLIALRAAELRGFGGAHYAYLAAELKRHPDRLKKHVAAAKESGHVMVDSSPGRGSKATVRLTAKGRREAEAARGAISAPSVARK